MRVFRDYKLTSIHIGLLFVLSSMALNVFGTFLFRDAARDKTCCKVWHHWQIMNELKSSLDQELRPVFKSPGPVSRGQIQFLEYELATNPRWETVGSNIRKTLDSLIRRSNLLEQLNESFQILIRECGVSSEPGEGPKTFDSAEYEIAQKTQLCLDTVLPMWQKTMDHFEQLKNSALTTGGQDKNWWESANNIVLTKALCGAHSDITLGLFR